MAHWADEEAALFALDCARNLAQRAWTRDGCIGNIDDYIDEGIEAIIGAAHRAKNPTHFRALSVLNIKLYTRRTSTVYRRWRDGNGQGISAVTRARHHIPQVSRTSVTSPDPFLRETLGTWLAGLSDFHRDVVFACWIDGLSLREAAREQGCDYKTVGSHLEKLRKALLAKLRPPEQAGGPQEESPE